MTNDLLKIVPTLQAVALLKENVKESQKKKPKLMKMAVGNIVGVNLIKVQSDIIAGL